MQDQGVSDLKAAVNLDDYREAEQKEIGTILENGEETIRQTKDQAEIDKVIKDASDQIGKLKTDAQYTKEEEEEAARLAELERQRQEEEAAAAAAAASKKKSKKKSSGNGCVGGGSDAFY